MSYASERADADDATVLAYLKERGPKPNYLIVVGTDIPFRRVDRSLQRLKRRGTVELLPRVKKERPQSLWQLRSAESATPPTGPVGTPTGGRDA